LISIIDRSAGVVRGARTETNAVKRSKETFCHSSTNGNTEKMLHVSAKPVLIHNNVSIFEGNLPTW